MTVLRVSFFSELLVVFPLFNCTFLHFAFVCISTARATDFLSSILSFGNFYSCLTSPDRSLHLHHLTSIAYFNFLLSPNASIPSTSFSLSYSQVRQHPGGDHFQAGTRTQRKWVCQMVSSICRLSLQSVLNYVTIHGRSGKEFTALPSHKSLED